MLLTTINDKFNITKATPHKTIAEFCGADSPNQVSNGDTIGHFRNLLEKYKLQEKLFDKVIEILTENALSRSEKADRKDKYYVCFGKSDFG